MGTLTYDSKLTATFEDRALAHLQIVIWAKLRRGESFSFTFTDSERATLGRSSIWLAPNISLAFQYFGGRAPRLNPRWVEALMLTANSAGGLQLVPEPEESDAS